MTGLKGHAFAGLMRWRYGAQRSGIDRVAQRHARVRSVLRSSYHALYRLLEPSQIVTGELRGLHISADARQRDLALLLMGARSWEDGQMQLIESLLEEGMVFVDVGAHIGVYTLLAARCVGPRGKVFAFEPAPQNYRALRHNIAANAFSNVVAEPLAVSRRRGKAAFTLSENDSASHSLARGLHAGRPVDVDTVSLDDYFSGSETPIDVVKLDAEGAELRILEGMQEILSRNPRLVLFTELYPRAMDACESSPEEFLARLRDIGFEISLFEEGQRHQQELGKERVSEIVDELRKKGTAINLLCRRGDGDELPAVRSSPAISIQPENGPEKLRDPLISVAIPTYNRVHLLERTLASAASQLGEDVEILVYDTGSTDETCDRMERLAAQNASVRFFRLDERKSLDETLLLLLGTARGEYIWFFSSDDEMKPGAIEAVRRRILRPGRRAALIYVNQEIVDEGGHLLIASQVGSRRDREFADGRQIAPWLGMNLGFISASVIRRDTALHVSSALEFIGTRSLNLHIYLICLLHGGPALYVGQPLIRARRASGAPPYEYRDVFVRHIVRILADARRRGFGHYAIYRAMHRIVVGQYLPLVLSWRCDDPAELARTFPEMRRAFWTCPSLWFFVLPVRLAPTCLARAIRNRLRRWRERRNERIASRWVRVREGAARQS